jgi:penicillin-binding protein 1C
MLANAQLPQPLRHFRSRQAAFAADATAPEVAFPPDGAEVELLPEGLMVQVAGGTAPFTWLADGAPVITAQTEATAMLPALGRGFITLSVIDAEGRSARTRVRLR